MAPREKTKDVQEKLIHNMQRWQKVEEKAVEYTGKVAAKTPNPIVKHILTIIQRDSEMHHRTQQLIVDLLKGTVRLTPDELAETWDQIEKHIETEHQAIELAREAKQLLLDRHMPVPEYLVGYLLADEEKHNALLDQLRLIKDKMYPYA